MKANLFSLLVILISALIMTWLLSGANAEEVQLVEQGDSAAFTVTALQVTPQSSSSLITVTGIAKARWQLDLVSPVSGKVKMLPAHIEPGIKLTKGSVLSQVDDKPYQSELVLAQANVAQAELELARYQHEQYVVKQVNTQAKSNAFGRFEPHIKSAKAELVAAKARLNYAQQRLADTKITAPYDAIVLDRFITPSQWLNEGDLTFKLAATDAIDIELELSESEWLGIGEFEQGADIKVQAPLGKIWQAKVRYIHPSLNPQTRQRHIVLTVEQPFSGEQPLMPEQQVLVTFVGKERANVVQAPATVLTQDNQVWSVIDGKLALELVDIIDEQGDSVAFQYQVAQASPRTLVRFPISTMLVGQKVAVNMSEKEVH